MPTKQTPPRRIFLKQSATALVAGAFPVSLWPQSNPIPLNQSVMDPSKSLIGQYGPWAANLANDPPLLSFRRANAPGLKRWQKEGRSTVSTFLGAPKMTNNPKVTIHKKYSHDGLDIEELSWPLPYGRPTEAILLKPKGAKGPLPGILGLHDHGGNKFFGKRKITITGEQHPLMIPHQKNYYEGSAWANELAKRGYAVLVPDNFTFGSRRVYYEDVTGFSWGPLKTDDLQAVDENKFDDIAAYNEWAARHEHIMAKSLFCGGTTWPGVFLNEDQRALDVLCAREEVDPERVGCAGLSGGGLRTAYLGGMDPRIQCAVAVGFMTTWRDLLLYKSYTHTWMTYIPILPNYLDFPEVFGLRAPLPTMVLNNKEDQLFTLEEMKRADEILREVFKNAKAEDRYQCNFYDGLHKFDLKMQQDAFNWMDQWLKGK